MSSGANLKHTSAFNYQIVLETIRLHGPISRAQIARRTDLTAQTISNIVRKLMDEGLIVESERCQTGRGAPSTPVRVNPHGAFSIGIDLDQDHLTGVLVDLEGRVRRRIREELDFPPPDLAIEHVAHVTDALLAREGLDRSEVWGLGLGFPGPVGITKGGRAVNAVNPIAFPGWNNVPIVHLLSRRLAMPVHLENNATAAAMGERWYGEGRHIGTFFYVFLGLGLGGGLVIDGRPVTGQTGNAGEIGYAPVSDRINQPEPFYQSHLGIFFNLPRLYQNLSETGVTVHDPSGLADVYSAKNPALLRWLDEAARHLAPHILSVEYLIDPEAILFGGRWPEVLIQDLMDRLRRFLATLRLDRKPVSPRLVVATSGPDAAALGLATLPLHASFAPRIERTKPPNAEKPEFEPSSTAHS